MNNILKKIYEDVLVNEDEIKEMRKEIDEVVKNCVRVHKESLSIDEQEELSHLLFSTSYAAEKTGFEVGVWFMFKLLISGKEQTCERKEER